MINPIPDSFTPGDTGVCDRGQLAHPEAIAHVRRLARRFYAVGENAWTLVGNGLSNQTFVRGPEGIIAIDTGESIEEMKAALAALRRATDEPIVACIYTHFHYVGGTQAIVDEGGNTDLSIYGHAKIEHNLSRMAGEVAPRSRRGLVYQFGVTLPEDGQDGLVSCGLGLFFRNPDHAPYTHGHIPADNTFEAPVKTIIAGLDVEMTPAPSDADDSITIWFPALRLCVNNLVWPALYNVFAIRGEEYRDPRILLTGIDHVAQLGAEYLIGTHGPPFEGDDEIRRSVILYRDSIQFMWDQTVRGANRGMNANELAEFVRLPTLFREAYFTTQHYGLVEHHVRQIYSGLFGWFDEDERHLFPLPDDERCRRLVEGFGGEAAVRLQVDAALEERDYRWAIELAGWLVRTDNDDGDRARLAAALRGIGQSTTSANLRNWCLTRARELEGSLDLGRFREHRFRVEEIESSPPETFVAVLRVLLDPSRCADYEEELRWEFTTGDRVGLRVRHCVAVPASGEETDLFMRLDLAAWAALLAGKSSLDGLIRSGAVEVSDEARVRRFLACFDIARL